MRTRSDEISILDAAAILGVHRCTLWRWVTAGVIKSRRRGWYRFVLLRDVAAFQAQRRQIARLKAVA